MTDEETTAASVSGAQADRQRVADALGYTCALEDISDQHLDINPVCALIAAVRAEAEVAGFYNGWAAARANDDILLPSQYLAGRKED